jgi:Ricin-type beta-trefoil lectin domain/Putative Ig domain
MQFRSPSRAVRLPGFRCPRRAGAVIAAAGVIMLGLAASPVEASTVGASAARPARVRPLQPRPPLDGQRLIDPQRALTLPPNVRRACSLATKAGEMECTSLVRTNTKHYLGVVQDQAVSGYGPSQLQSAYNLSSASAGGGAGETVAVVAAYDDPNAVSDLAVYRAEFGLPACSPTTGAGCVTKENENGQATPLPSTEPAVDGDGWETTESVDLDMISAICPNCHILLIEAISPNIGDLGPAENTAAGSGAAVIANSWNNAEYSSEVGNDDQYFNHAGVAITVASGGDGYGTTWPTTSQFVTAVGGTTLTQDAGVPRGWTESVWNDSGGATGSGCSLAEPKASWQTTDDTSPNGCLNRTENDVAAVADPETGVAMYDTYTNASPPGTTGWTDVGGSSVPAAIIAAVYALAGSPRAGTYPASYPYQSGHAADLYDVTSGSNGACETNRQYLCHAETGYDGPTGLGTPDGTGAFTDSATGNLVTLTNPGVQDLETDTAVFVAMQGNDSAGLALKYSATGLPSGLSIGASTGRITGALGSSSSTSTVKVTAKDSTGAVGTVTFSIVVAKPLTTGYHVVSGPVTLDMSTGAGKPLKCLDDRGGGTKAGTVVDEYQCSSTATASQNWEFEPDGNPGGPGTFIIHNLCLDLAGPIKPEDLVNLETCNGSANEKWMIVGSAGQLYNVQSKMCLADPGGDQANSRQLWVWNCDGGSNQAWIPSGSPVQSGVSGMCVDDNHDYIKSGNKIQIWGCLGNAAQKWTDEPDQTLRLGGMCMTVNGSSLLDGATVLLETCSSPSTHSQQWVTGPGGELINVASGRCLTDPANNTTQGTALVQEDCYGLLGQIWAVT